MTRTLTLAILLLATPAYAEDWQNAFFGHSSAYRNPDEHHRHRHYAPRRAPQVRSWVHVEPVERWSERDNCKPLVKVVGIEAHSEEIARQRAIAQWSAMVRFSAGERYMQFSNSRGKRFMCSISTVPGVGLAAELREGAANVIGKTSDGIRCQLVAHPCSAPEGEEVR